jgi:mannitol/fructose-specific phosphotransferase system IIA component (Ntr-type)
MTLSHPVDFGNPENDPVDLVFAFGATDKDSHIQALKDLADILAKPKLVERIRSAESKDEILDLLARQIAV